jgi:hypothetical protein
MTGMNRAARESRAGESGEWTGKIISTVKVGKKGTKARRRGIAVKVETPFEFFLSATLREKGEGRKW